jgi:hypothetical protein
VCQKQAKFYLAIEIATRSNDQATNSIAHNLQMTDNIHHDHGKWHNAQATGHSIGQLAVLMGVSI